MVKRKRERHQERRDAEADKEGTGTVVPSFGTSQQLYQLDPGRLHHRKEKVLILSTRGITHRCVCVSFVSCGPNPPRHFPRIAGQQSALTLALALVHAMHPRGAGTAT
jgi:hypothetical protein